MWCCCEEQAFQATYVVSGLAGVWRAVVLSLLMHAQGQQGRHVNLVFSYGVGAERAVFAPIDLEEHSLISTAVVAMPRRAAARCASHPCHTLWLPCVFRAGLAAVISACRDLS